MLARLNFVTSHPPLARMDSVHPDSCPESSSMNRSRKSTLTPVQSKLAFLLMTHLLEVRTHDHRDRLPSVAPWSQHLVLTTCGSELSPSPLLPRGVPPTAPPHHDFRCQTSTSSDASHIIVPVLAHSVSHAYVPVLMPVTTPTTLATLLHHRACGDSRLLAVEPLRSFLSPSISP